MKKLLVFLFLLCSYAGFSQNPFPTTDSMRNYINRYIRNSAVEAFQNLRLNRVLNGVSSFVDSSYGRQIDTAYATNDSTIRIVTIGNDTFNIVIRGAAGGGGLDTVYAANGIAVNGDTLKQGGTLNQHTYIDGQNSYNYAIDNLRFLYFNGKFLDASFDSTFNMQGDTINFRPTTGTYNHGKMIMSGTSGFLGLHRLTTAQRTALTGVLAGAMVWDTDLSAVYRYDGSAWAAIGGGSYLAGSGLTLSGSTFKGFGTYSENHTSALTTSYYHDFTSGANTVMRVNGIDANVSVGNTPFSSGTLLTLNTTAKTYFNVWTNGATVQYIFERLGKTTFQNYTSSNGGAKDPQLTLSMTRNPTSGSTAGATLYIQPNLVGSGSYTGSDYGIEIVAGGTLTKFQGLRTNGYIEMTTAHALNLPANTTTERGALVLHRAGSFIWNSSLTKLQYYDGSGWKSVQDSIAALPPKFTPIASDASGFTASAGVVYTLADLTGASSSTITLPSAATWSGWEIVFWNNSADATNKWSYAAAITLPDGTTRTTFADGTVDRLISNGSVWIKIN